MPLKTSKGKKVAYSLICVVFHALYAFCAFCAFSAFCAFACCVFVLFVLFVRVKSFRKKGIKEV